MKTIRTMMAIVLIALASSAGTQNAQAQEPENYVWITNTNGITWKETMGGSNTHLHFQDAPSIRPTVAQIVVPEHTGVDQIDMRGCVNLTNLIFRPPNAKQWRPSYTHPNAGYYSTAINLTIYPTPSLRTIAMKPEMIQRTDIIKTRSDAIPAYLLRLEWTTNWQAGDPPKMEIRTTTTARGKEVEVIWRIGNLQLADAVSGEWKDYNGSSPYRFPLASAKDMQFFRIKPEEEEEPEENQGTPPQPEK